MNRFKKPVVLCILDGWGVRPDALDNAITQAHTPVWNRLVQTWPYTTLDASGNAVGLPEGQMGNSEVGHMTMGAGRIIFQDLPKINKAFQEGTFLKHPLLLDMISTLQKEKKSCHLMGLLSDGGVHAHLDHLLAVMVFLAEQKIPVWIHGFLDGRDTPPKSALFYLQKVDTLIKKYSPFLRWGTLGGRYFGMDRDRRWERIQKAYQEIASPLNIQKDASETVTSFYTQGITDEFIPPFSLNGYPGIEKGDGLLMVNFRSDRIRQILLPLLDPTFEKFPREQGFIPFSNALSLTDVSSKHTKWIKPLFPHEIPAHILGEIISKAGYEQLRISETEKYAHVTFFLNGGHESFFPGEERILVPSPSVSTYDLQPEMAAKEITERLVLEISKKKYDFIVVNYANADMVGHTGNQEATITAIETMDACLGQLTQAILKEKGCLLITADHGNAEMMRDPQTGEMHTAHTCNRVPCLLIGERTPLRAGGGLEDIAPTLLNLMGLPVPQVMTGKTLLEPISGDGPDPLCHSGRGSAEATRIALPFILLFLLTSALFAKENSKTSSQERVSLESSLNFEEDSLESKRKKNEEEQMAFQTQLKSLNVSSESLQIDAFKKKQDLDKKTKEFSSFLGKIYGFSQKSPIALLTRQYPSSSFIYMKLFLHMKMKEFQKNIRQMKQEIQNFNLLEKTILEEQGKYKILLENALKEAKGIREERFRQIEELTKKYLNSKDDGLYTMALEMPATGKILLPKNKKKDKIKRIQIQTSYSAEVFSPNSGVVTHIELKKDPKFLIINHGSGYSSILSNLESFQVCVGKTLYAGEIVGKMAGYGKTPPVLTFEFIFEFQGKRGLLDPLPGLRRGGWE